MIESLITHQALISWCITNSHLLDVSFAGISVDILRDCLFLLPHWTYGSASAQTFSNVRPMLGERLEVLHVL